MSKRLLFIETIKKENRTINIIQKNNLIVIIQNLNNLNISDKIKNYKMKRTLIQISHIYHQIIYFLLIKNFGL